MPRFNSRKIVKRRSYSFEDVNALFGITRSTWRLWLRNGLAVIDETAKPVLVMGFDLVDFFARKKTSKFKGKLGPEEFYCKPCDVITLGEAGSVRTEPTGKKVGKNDDAQMIRRAVCEFCGRPLRRYCPIGDADYTGVHPDKGTARNGAGDSRAPVTMRRPLHKNEMAKREFFFFLRHAKGSPEGTLGKYEQALSLWEDFTDNADFAQYNKDRGRGFKEWLDQKKKAGSDEPVSVSYRYDMLRLLHAFFDWLSRRKPYRNIDPQDVEYLRPSKTDVRIAHQPQVVEFPPPEEIRRVIEHIEVRCEVDRCDKALLSLMSLTGIRVKAALTLRMKSFDRATFVLRQGPEFGTKTKFGKRIISVLAPLFYPERVSYFTDWHDYLVERGFGPDDPVFPVREVKSGVNGNVSFQVTGRVLRRFGKSTSIIRKMFAKRFADAGVRYYHPHTLRHALAAEIEKAPLSDEEKKCYSLSMGHADLRMTFGGDGYGRIPEERLIEILKKIDLGRPGVSPSSRLHSDDISLIVDGVISQMGRSGGNERRKKKKARKKGHPPVSKP